MPPIILIVNDHPLTRHMVRHHLERHGYQCVEAVDGEDALNKLKDDPTIRLVITDIDMPRMNGWELIKAIRAEKEQWLKNIPCIVMSAFYSTSEGRTLGKALGADGAISVPFKPIELIQEVEDVLKGAPIQQRGRVALVLKCTCYSSSRWAEALERSGFQVITEERTSGNLEEDVLAIIASGIELNEVESLRSSFGNPPIFTVLHGKGSQMDFLAKGVTYSFRCPQEPEYIAYILARDCSLYAHKEALRLLRARMPSSSFLTADDLANSLARLDYLGVAITKDDLTPILVNRRMRELLSMFGLKDDKALKDQLKEDVVGLKQGARTVVLEEGGLRKVIEYWIERGTATNVIVARDITRERRLNHFMEQEAKLDSVLTVTGGMAHDLNNILMQVSGLIQLMDERLRICPSKKNCVITHDFLCNIVDACKKASSMLRNFMDFFRSSEGQEIIEINTLITELTKFLKKTFKNVDFKFEPRLSSVRVLADKNVLEAVFTNIIINGIRAMGESGTIEIESGVTFVSQELVESGQLGYVYSGFNIEPGRFAWVSIKDQGTGIEPHILPRIFEPYFTTYADNGGTGLGLAMCYNTVNGYGGLISVESELGKGTIFTVYLPFSQGKDEEKKEEISSHTEESTPTEIKEISGLKVLVVDDEAPIRSILKEFLSMKGAECMEAVNGKEALALLDETPDIGLIILDHNMPVMNGLAFLEETKGRPSRPPVILATGRIEDYLQNKAKALRVAALIQKPYSFNTLLTTIEKVISNKSTQDKCP